MIAPREDVKLGGISVWKHSTTLKNVVARLDAYHAQLDRLGDNAPGAFPKLRLAHEQLLAALEKYGSEKHSFNAEIRVVLDEVRAEAQVLASAQQLLDDPPRGTPETPHRILELCRQKLPNAILREALASEDFSQANIIEGSLKPLGKGAIGAVFQVDYLIRGERVAMVFKPEAPGAALRPKNRACRLERPI